LPPPTATWQRPPATAGQGPPPVVFQQLVRTVTPRRSRVGGWIVFAIVLAVLIPVGFTVYNAISDVRDATGRTAAPPTVVNGSMGGGPVTVPYRNAQLQVEVTSAVAQPVDGWSSSARLPDPKLVVAVTVTRTDTEASDTSVMAWDWHFQPSEGPVVEGELITSYQPELESTPLGTGQSISGLITFDTGADTGTLTVDDPYTGDHPVAQWNVVAPAPKVVTGSVGKPATGLIAGPGFTVTLAKPQWLKTGDKRLRDDPKTHSVLRVEFTVTGLRNEYAGQIEASDLWFTPRGGKPIQAGYPGHLMQSTVLVSISDVKPQKMMVGFDVKKTPGVLELRESSGLTVIRWPIS
jgi:hypothetical protein